MCIYDIGTYSHLAIYTIYINMYNISIYVYLYLYLYIYIIYIYIYIYIQYLYMHLCTRKCEDKYLVKLLVKFRVLYFLS